MAHPGNVNAVAFSRDGQWVVSGSSDGTAQVWNAATGVEVAHKNHAASVYSVAFSSDGQWVVSGCTDGTVQVWNAANGDDIVQMRHDKFVTSVAFGPDRSRVVSGSVVARRGYGIRIPEPKSPKWNMGES